MFTFHHHCLRNGIPSFHSSANSVILYVAVNRCCVCSVSGSFIPHRLSTVYAGWTSQLYGSSFHTPWVRPWFTVPVASSSWKMPSAL